MIVVWVGGLVRFGSIAYWREREKEREREREREKYFLKKILFDV